MKYPILLRESFSRYSCYTLPGYSVVMCPGPVVLIPDALKSVPSRLSVIIWNKEADSLKLSRIDIGNNLQGAAL
jgi:hypothetical protein